MKTARTNEKNSHRSLTGLATLTLVLIVSFFFFGANRAEAAYMKNVPQTLTQPDGTTLNCFVSGDEFYHWLHDANNFTIIQDTTTGFYVYATKEGNSLVPTNLIAGKTNPSRNLLPGINIEGSAVASLSSAKFSVPSFKGSCSTSTTGTINNIVIFVRFSDQAEYTDQVSKYEQLYNAEGTPSVMQYFQEVSGSQLSINSAFFPRSTGKTVVSFQDSKARNYYCRYNATTNPAGFQNDNERVTREMSLLKSAVESVKAQLEASGLNFDTDHNGQIDNVTFMVQGATDGWSDLLWPHQWALYAANVKIGQARVWNYNLLVSAVSGLNVMVHEMSHTLGFPDLYRYTNNTINPVGPWDAMSSTTNPPQHETVYTKEKYGHWTNSIPEITANGTYNLEALANNPFAAFKIASPNSTSEYFVVEYRRTTGMFESSLLGSGLVVYRVVPSQNGNSFGQNDEVYVYRPNGTNAVDGDLAKAFYTADENRTELSSCFLSNGTDGGVHINNIGTSGETISFTVTFGDTDGNKGGTSGISTETTGSNLNVYPNPSVKDFTVQLDNFNGMDKKLEVLNMMGQVATTQTLTQGTTTIDCAGLPKGMYIFRVTAENNSVSYTRVVKN